jgi:hypothetical protein
MIPGYDPIDLTLLSASEDSYGTCDVNSDLAHVLFVHLPGILIVAHRGTEPQRIIDLYTDVDIVSVIAPEIGLVDAGFYRSTCSVAWRVLPYIIERQAAGDLIMPTGHSKGGTEAQFTTCMLTALKIPVARLTTFEPACGLGPEAQAMIAHIPGVTTRNGPDKIPYEPGKFTNRPLSQLGFHGAEIDGMIPSIWIPYHLLSGVRPAFISAIAPDVPMV